ncbi:MAG: hypothetical protein A2700_01380 [Candidatus Blackburnbacteria bacterium RIFCSPHIGHO2_01_FULL_44_64]|uniref:Uncharacterized protein n=1 Tax=Candidatus Blackburnbacteria bacterium RIFCSPHIGHO2_02_FULL_44_20 TaxID=1797516 RepID=A0A1G1V4R2_9BACT|nr:MAG: hypothetical protein A2700_01380 [Candidatus Blackburnbacteria bacterium RIFCSPHIGHO2_01_FULL_44_64]OGY10332.1 MAG: hypothetical protein A3D26_03465 [Candidatus Blackburnbacteria bacterium RIFCSPHIGHO2_02_FULL_44_20]OGY11970.1 MAG: hypothetical protein A3E16_02075 [Candidatus Blackburnbacteria bacterium RIFCSPHIGHO2_12_FULL_44_25]OGY14820.1 MAG: hypothetical protein A3A62_03465 [Candidatus Blackburnbacteria bacterium RIFCSPLOWO2_01_FULL_44_43]
MTTLQMPRPVLILQVRLDSLVELKLKAQAVVSQPKLVRHFVQIPIISVSARTFLRMWVVALLPALVGVLILSRVTSFAMKIQTSVEVMLPGQTAFMSLSRALEMGSILVRVGFVLGLRTQKRQQTVWDLVSIGMVHLVKIMHQSA